MAGQPNDIIAEARVLGAGQHSRQSAPTATAPAAVLPGVLFKASAGKAVLRNARNRMSVAAIAETAEHPGSMAGAPVFRRGRWAAAVRRLPDSPAMTQSADGGPFAKSCAKPGLGEFRRWRRCHAAGPPFRIVCRKTGIEQVWIKGGIRRNRFERRTARKKDANLQSDTAVTVR